MTKRVVILGGGTGGTLLANRLARHVAPGSLEVAVVDQDDRHLYQPGLLFVPFGLADPDDLVRPRRSQFRAGIDFHQAAVDRVDVDARAVHLAGGAVLPYDVLVVASGASLLYEETEGLLGPGWGDVVGTFYDLPGAVTLAGQLERLRQGRLVVNVVDMPVKCPVAPLEFCFLADWHLRRRGVRADVEIVYATPLDGAFTKPIASRELGALMERRGIRVVTEFNTGEVDGAAKRLVSYDGREEPFDLAVVVPLHGGAPYVGRSPGLGDALGFIDVDRHTLQSTTRPEIFAIGDAAGVPASKAGSVAHFEGETVAANILHQLHGEPLEATFDGHANCFVETGDRRALLIDFNYDTEPLPGRYPGPMGLPLLRESRLNHLAKLLFGWVYWHSLLPGHDVPGVTATMPERGKRRAA